MVYSLHSSVITPLGVHSRKNCFVFTPFYLGLKFSVATTDFHQLEKKRGKETCSALLLFCRHTRNHPHSFSLTARIIHSRLLAENTEQNLIVNINNNSTHSRRYRRNVSHLHVLLCLDNSLAPLIFCAPTDHDKESDSFY